MSDSPSLLHMTWCCNRWGRLRFILRITTPNPSRKTQTVTRLMKLWRTNNRLRFPARHWLRTTIYENMSSILSWPRMMNAESGVFWRRRIKSRPSVSLRQIWFWNVGVGTNRIATLPDGLPGTCASLPEDFLGLVLVFLFVIATAVVMTLNVVL